MDRSVGALPAEFDMVIECYLALNPEQRDTAGLLDRIGAGFLAASPQQDLRSDARASILERIGDTPTQLTRWEPPQPVRACMDGTPDKVRWSRVLPWLAAHRLQLDEERPGAASWLLKIRRGYAVPSHTHLGQEMTLVLQGGYSDSDGCYRRGDLSAVDGTTQHRPVADTDTACIVLIAYDKPQRLTGPIGRIVERFRNP